MEITKKELPSPSLFMHVIFLGWAPYVLHALQLASKYSSLSTHILYLHEPLLRLHALLLNLVLLYMILESCCFFPAPYDLPNLIYTYNFTPYLWTFGLFLQKVQQQCRCLPYWDSVEFSMGHCRLSIGRMRGDFIHLEALAGRLFRKSGGDINRFLLGL